MAMVTAPAAVDRTAALVSVEPEVVEATAVPYSGVEMQAHSLAQRGVQYLYPEMPNAHIGINIHGMISAMLRVVCGHDRDTADFMLRWSLTASLHRTITTRLPQRGPVIVNTDETLEDWGNARSLTVMIQVQIDGHGIEVSG